MAPFRALGLTALVLGAVGGCAASIPPGPVRSGAPLAGRARLRIEHHIGSLDGFKSAIPDVADRKAVAASEAALGRRRAATWMSETGLFQEVLEGTATPGEVAIEISISNDSTGENYQVQKKFRSYTAAFRGTLTCKTSSGVPIASYFERLGDGLSRPTPEEVVRSVLEALETRLLKRLVDDAEARGNMQAVFEGRFKDPALASGRKKLDSGDFEGALRDFALALEHDARSASALGGRARARLAKGDSAGALQDAEQAIALDPKLPDGYRARGFVLLERGNNAGALADYTTLISLDARLPQAFYNRGRAHHRLKNWDAAIGDYSKALDLNPDPNLKSSLLFDRALAWSEKGHRDAAIADYTRFLEQSPAHMPAFANRSREKRLKGDMDGALADADKAVELAPALPQVHHDRAMIRNSKGDVEGALADLAKAMELAPDFPESYRQRATIRRARGDEPGAQADLAMASIAEGNGLSARGNLDGAIALYTQVIGSHPNHALAFDRRGVARTQKKELEAAVADCSKALELDPGFGLAYVHRANARAAKGDAAGAEGDYAKASEVAPGDVRVYYERGLARRLQGERARSVADFTNAIERSPNHVNALWYRALGRFEQGESDLAIADATRVLELNPRFAPAFNIRGSARLNKGEVDPAAADFGKAVELDPRFADALNNVGRVKYAKKNYDGAIADFSRVMELDPTYVHAPYNRGLAKAAKGDRGGAIADFSKVLTLDPRRADAWYQRGLASSQARNHDGAIADCTKALELDPKLAPAHLTRGNARWGKGDLNGAAADFTRALELDPKLTDAQNNLNKVKTALATPAATPTPPRPAPAPAAGPAALAVADRFDAIWAVKPKLTDLEGSGLYSLENELGFNVLDGAVFDPKRGTLSLYGHWDGRFAGTRILWLQHLAELLEHPQPQFSLGWTAESSRQVDRFLEVATTPQERMRIGSEWGKVLNAGGGVSNSGRLLLPAMGVTPTRNGAAPADAGITVAWRKNPLQEYLEVMSVASGSAGQAAGLTVGDRIFTLNDGVPIEEKNFYYQIRTLGAGATCKMWVRKGEAEGRMVTMTLRPAAGDPWAGLTPNELAVCIFRSAGMAEAAEITYWTDVFNRLKEGPHEDEVWLAFLDSLGLKAKWKNYDRLIRRGQKDKNEAVLEIIRGIASGMDSAYRLTGNPGLNAWEASYRKNRDPMRALDDALGVVEGARKGALSKALDSLRARPGGIQIPPEMIEATYQVRPVVQPEYIGIDGSSQLARVLFESDYIGKRLVHSPALSSRVPGYMTVFEFERRHPNSVRRTGGTQTYRMWISVARLAAAESADGSTLDIRDAQMQVNIRERGGDGRDLPPIPGGYEALLTSLYDPLSREFRVLHELRECAKLAAVAKWILAKRPGTTFPKDGRTAWRGPSTLPGLVFMYLYPPTPTSNLDTTIIAAGGCSLKLPLEAFPKDAGIVDLRESPLTVTPEAYRNETLSRVMGKKVEVPEWHPEGWVTRARKGERAVSAVTVALERSRTDPKSSLELREKLERARQAAERLAQVERAINILTRNNIDRQAEFKELRSSLEKSEEEFVESSLRILTSGLFSLKAASAHPSLTTLTQEAQAVQEELERLQKAVDAAEAAWKAARAGDAKARAEAALAVTKALGQAIEAGTSKALGPLRPYLNPVHKSLSWAGKLEDAFKVGQSLNTLRTAGNRIEQLNLQVEREGAALRDSLLPMQRTYSDELDRLRQDPDVRRATGG